MTELTRWKKSRGAYRNVIKSLIVKAQDFMKEGPGERTIGEVDAILKLVKVKEGVIAELNSKILGAIEEAEIDTDVKSAADFEIKIYQDLTEIERFLERKAVHLPTSDARQSINASSTNKGVKLPKIVIKKFSGDPVAW